MPAEWAPHARCWMGWPCRSELWGERISQARGAYAEVARAIADFEPVTMLARPEHVAEASVLCGGRVQVMPMELDDSWLRDYGPIFLCDPAGNVAATAWRFNGWGGKYSEHRRDAMVAGHILRHLGARCYDAPLVLEGGAISVDGEGTLLTTEQCLLNPNRNPGLDRRQVEEALHEYLGVTRVVWLGDGLLGDETDGHVDNLACFVRPGVVLALTVADPSDPDHAALQDNLDRLRGARDAAGQPLEVIPVLAPAQRERWKRRLTMSYINFYLANGAVILPVFEDANDSQALTVMEKAFPDRDVVPVAGLELVQGGGSVHCITQQQPAGPVLR